MIALRHAATRLAVFSVFIFALFTAASFYFQAVAVARQAHSLLEVAPIVVDVAAKLRSQRPAQLLCSDSHFSRFPSPPETGPTEPCGGDGNTGVTLKERRVSSFEFTGRDWKPDLTPPRAKAENSIEPSHGGPAAFRRKAVRSRWELPWSRDPPNATAL